MKNWYDYRRLREIPRWVLVLWSLFLAITLLSMFQEATHLFYGPRRTVYGNGATYAMDASRDWQSTMAYLMVPMAWALAWCGRFVGAVFLPLLVLVVAAMAWTFMTHEFLLAGGGGSSWSHTGTAGSGVAAPFSNRTILRFLADPAGESYWVLNTVAVLAWPMMFIIRDFQTLHRYKIIGKECLKCGYSLRGTPSGVCPECGRQNPVYKQK